MWGQEVNKFLKKTTSRFVCGKILELIMTLFIVTIISFLLIKLSPVDPAEAYARRSFAVAGYTDEMLSNLRHDMGLDKPLLVQYFDWAKGAIKLEFGKSLVTGSPVYETVTKALSVTGAVVLLSGLIQVFGILIFGCLCYRFRKNIIGKIFDFLCIAGISIPAFYLASSFLDIFATKYHIVSVTNYTGIMKYLPAAVCLSVGCIAFFAQLLSKKLEHEMKEDSANYARCRGLSEKRILICHALPHAVGDLLPNFFQMLGLCLAGAAVLERVFSLPGLGYLIIDSVMLRDAPMIHATVLFLAFALVICNILSDIVRRLLYSSMSEGGD